MTTDTDDLRALPDPDEFLPDGVYGNREVRFAMRAYAQAARAPLLAEIERLQTPMRADLEGLAQRTMERLKAAEHRRDELLEQIEREEQRAIAAENLAEGYGLQIKQQAEIIEKSYQAREKAERERDELFAKFEVSEAASKAAVSKAEWQARTNSELNALIAERDGLRARLEAIYAQPRVAWSTWSTTANPDLIERPRRPDPLEGEVGCLPIERLK